MRLSLLWRICRWNVYRIKRRCKILGLLVNIEFLFWCLVLDFNFLYRTLSLSFGRIFFRSIGINNRLLLLNCCSIRIINRFRSIRIICLLFRTKIIIRTRIILFFSFTIRRNVRILISFIWIKRYRFILFGRFSSWRIVTIFNIFRFYWFRIS